MNKKTLAEEFNVSFESLNMEAVKDYGIFNDKVLLDNLRQKIIQNIIDNTTPNSKNLEEYINDEIDAALKGYDLTNLERSHIFNLIDNEINGYGPINELLNDKNIT